MNKQEKLIKRTAEGVYYLDEKISQEEYNLLKNSKYKNLISPLSIKRQSYKIIEKLKQENSPIRENYYSSIDIEVIEDLIDEIEEEFNLGIETDSDEKQNQLNVEDLKNFIYEYLETNKIDSVTRERIKRICKKNTPRSILMGILMLV